MFLYKLSREPEQFLRESGAVASLLDDLYTYTGNVFEGTD